MAARTERLCHVPPFPLTQTMAAVLAPRFTLQNGDLSYCFHPYNSFSMYQRERQQEDLEMRILGGMPYTSLYSHHLTAMYGR